MNLSQLRFSSSLDENIETMKRIFQGDNTFICRIVRGQGEPALRCALFFFDGMVESESINTAIVRPVTRW